MHSLSNLGKILTLLAGLVAVLDPIGEAQLKSWFKAARKRRDQARVRSGELAKARRWLALVKRVAVLVAIHDSPLRPKLLLDPKPYSSQRVVEPRPEDKEYVRPEVFKRFADEAWSAITATNEHSKTDLNTPVYMAMRFEPMVYNFLIQHLPGPESADLRLAYDGAQRGMRRSRRVRTALLAAVLPGAISLGLWFWMGGIPAFISLFVAWMAVTMAALAANALLMTPGFITALQHSSATAGVWLAGAGSRAMKGGGRWLRIAALVVFIAGSMLDLLGGWKE